MYKKFNELTQSLTPKIVSLITPLHNIAMKKDCKYRIDKSGADTTIVYSTRNFKIIINSEAVSFEGEYDIRAFMKLYRETDTKTVQELLFNSAHSCCYCIDDKCTTLLMAKQRTIELDGETKKLCGPYRHYLRINVTEATLSACITIANMMFKYAYSYPIKHTDLFDKNEVTYTLVEKNEFYIVGYMQRHSQISPSDEDFISLVLQKNDNGERKIDNILEAVDQSDSGKYIGAIDNFINGVLYDFIFGIITDKKPEKLPDGAIFRKVRNGEWAVYNSSANDYKSIWRHYTNDFYKIEHIGFDKARIPYEYYDENGKFSDVHIPVDADMTANSSLVGRLDHMPNVKLAGFGNYSESDYSLFKDHPFNEIEEITKLFPLADKLVRVWIHSRFGKPLFGFEGVIVDDYTVLPDDIEFYEMKGGYWRSLGYRHFNGGTADWDSTFNVKLDSKVTFDDCQHPRGFNEYVYNARGGYVEIGIPARVVGNYTYEVVELPTQHVIGKLEAPPESIVTEEDKELFYTLPENIEKGSYMIGFTVVQVSNGNVYYDKPLIKGVLANADTPFPDNLSELKLESGKYVKITEDIPNGELGWECGFLLESMEKETGYKPDMTRQFIIKQNDFGKSYELYVPCGENTNA